MGNDSRRDWVGSKRGKEKLRMKYVAVNVNAACHDC